MSTDRPRFYFHKPAQARGGFSTYSTRRMKKDVRYLTEVDETELLAQVASMPMVRYRHRDAEIDDRLHLGVIAEEAPEAIVTNGRSSVDLYDYASLALAAVKALHKRIDDLSRQVQETMPRASARQ